MAIHQQTIDKLQLLNFHATAARTATGQGSGVDLLDYDGEVFLILDSGAGGSGCTLDVSIEDSADNSTFAAVSGVAFDQIGNTAARKSLIINRDELRRYVRIKYTIAGSTPSFTFSVNALGLKKYG